MAAVLLARTAAPFFIATCFNLTHRPVRVERSRDTHRCSARSMGVSTSLDTNGPGRVPIKRSRFQALEGREAGRCGSDEAGGGAGVDRLLNGWAEGGQEWWMERMCSEGMRPYVV